MILNEEQNTLASDSVSQNLEILLIGPLVFSEIVDHLRNTTTLVISRNQESLESSCDSKEKEFPSLMPTQTRWQGDVMALDEGEIDIVSLPAAKGLSISTDFVKYVVFFKDWAIFTICESKKSEASIKQILRDNGLPNVIDIQPEDAIGNKVN